ncbi:MAG: hypothetical protein Q8L48_10990 [Archangium sp.]|nr:hypothetical protein [Archangium sp.]
MGRARRASEQFRGHCRVLGLISPLVKGTAEIEEIETLTRAAEAGFNGLVLLEGLAREDALRKLESSLQTLEQKLEVVDAQIPMGWFREHFDASQASSVALADYAMLLGRHAGVDSTRLDRIQFLLTRLVSFFISPEDDSPALRRQLLAEALPPSTLAANTREAVVAFCHDATRRLGTFTRLKDLIDSGFFVDVRGYKLSLRQQLLDADVMAAVIELNEATTTTLDRLAEAEQQGEALEQHLAEVDQRIKAIFKQLRVDESEKTAQFEAWLKGSATARAAGRRPKARDFMALKANRREDRRLVLGAITLVLGLIFLFRIPAPQQLRVLTAAECTELSPVLVSGAVAPQKAPRIFVGTVDKSRWALMDGEGRRQTALKLAESVAARGWVAATVMLEEQVVMQIESGNVLVVQ